MGSLETKVRGSLLVYYSVLMPWLAQFWQYMHTEIAYHQNLRISLSRLTLTL